MTADEFIKSLSNQELAFLFKYKYDTYLATQKYRISNEIENRNLSAEELRGLIEDCRIEVSNDEENPNCPRCGSYKLRYQATEAINTRSNLGSVANGVNGSASYFDSVSCDVCGLIIDDENEEPFYLLDYCQKFFDFIKSGFSKLTGK